MSYLSRRVREDGRGPAYAEEWQRYLIQDAIAKTGKHIRQLDRKRVAGGRDPISFRGRAG